MIFGVDFGLKRIGLATITENIIIPLPPIIRKNRKQASKELQQVLAAYTSGNISSATLVFGIPLHATQDFYNETQDSKIDEMKRRVQHFLGLINFKGKVLFIDESYSSQEAEMRLQDRRYKARHDARKNGILDSISASIILERFLEKYQEKITIKNNTLPPLSMQQSKSQNHQQSTFINTKSFFDLFSNHQPPTFHEVKMPMQALPHIPVLLNEVIQTFDMVLNPKNPSFLLSPIKNTILNPTIIDCTLGFGGMSKTLLHYYDNVSIIGIDRDQDSIAYNTYLTQEFPTRFRMQHGSFAQVLPNIIAHSNHNSNAINIRGILADIGVSSYQLDTLSRGFSFHSKTLDMRMDTTQILHADYILNHYSQFKLEQIFKEYGEIRDYKKLSNLIIQARQKSTITSDIINNIALKIHTKSGIHPATLIYQALRIEVNDELGQLHKLLDSCENLKGVLLCIISFHSLEDRIIKQKFKQWIKTCICPQTALKCECGNNHAKGVILYKKPLSPTQEELHNNPRARSAKLRAFYFFEK